MDGVKVAREDGICSADVANNMKDKW